MKYVFSSGFTFQVQEFKSGVCYSICFTNTYNGLYILAIYDVNIKKQSVWLYRYLLSLTYSLQSGISVYIVNLNVVTVGLLIRSTHIFYMFKRSILFIHPILKNHRFA